MHQHWPPGILLCLGLAWTVSSALAQKVALESANVGATGQLLLVSGNVSTPQLLGNGSTVSWAGSVEGSYPGHIDTGGTTVIELDLIDVPVAYLTANYSCMFVNFSLANALESAPLQANSTTNSTDSQTLSEQYIQLVLSGLMAPQLTQPHLTANSSTNSSEGAVIASESASDSSALGGATADVTISCKAPAGSEDVVPAVLWGLPDHGNPGNAVGISIGSVAVRLQRVSVVGVSPPLGPDTGTNVTLTGQGFEAGVQCVLLDTATSYNVTVNATIISGSTANCTLPAYDSPTGNDSMVTLQVTWLDGCTLAPAYGLYPVPNMVSLWPRTVPRYGGGPLYLQLETSLTGTSLESIVGLQPTVRIRGGAANSSDLLLPATLTNRTGLLAVNVSDGTGPLPAGLHVVELSLNGQDYTGTEGGKELVVDFDGPTVAMHAAFGAVAPGDTQVNVSVHLIGRNRYPVSASLAVSQRAEAGVSNDALPTNLVLNDSLFWDAGEGDIMKTVTLNLPQAGEAAQFVQRALLVSVGTANNADIDPVRHTTIISSAPPSSLKLTFQSAVNQVVYAANVASIPVTVTPGVIPLPGSVKYEVDLLTAVDSPILPLQNGAFRGILDWDAANGTNAVIVLPIDWSQVPLWAEYRLALKLYPVFNSRVNHLNGSVALHIFGTGQGTCPPGTFLKPHLGDKALDPPPSVSDSSGGPSAPVPQRDAQLASIRLTNAADSEPISLSTAFIPSITTYGTIVAQTVTLVHLCLQPVHGTAELEVYNSQQALIPAQGQVITAIVPQQQAASAGRKLLRQLLLYTEPYRLQTSEHGWRRWQGQGRRAVLSTVGQGASVTACTGPDWNLSLAPGQNNYTIVVSSPAADSNKSGLAQGAMAASSANVSAMYALSIVQLSDPTHANLLALFSTVSKQTAPVCGPSSNAVLARNGSVVEGGNANTSAIVSPCVPDQLMYLNVSADTTWLSLNAGLLFPGIQGIRVEVNGEVLSQGGDVAADQVTDTTSAVSVLRNPAFLPAAIIIGLQPGNPLEVPIVVIAEDGITSQRYYLVVTRDLPPSTAPAPGPSAPYSSASGPDGSPLGAPEVAVAVDSYSSLGTGAALVGAAAELAASPAAEISGVSTALLAEPTEPQYSTGPSDLSDLEPGWPVPPGLQPACGACVSGWASSGPNSSYCSLCSPGTYSPGMRSPECSQCPAGTYASSWGSQHCKHCVLGTYGPSAGSQLCQMCPANFINSGDGSTSCPLTISPGTNLAERNAVIVSFGVYFNGTALNEIGSLVGVKASPLLVLSSLVRSDTASAFNISIGDVKVTGVTQIESTSLYVTVVASLPVDVAPDASEDAVRAALNVKSLSADDPISLLAKNPDKFFGRTTKALGVSAGADSQAVQQISSRPLRETDSALAWPAILGIVLGSIILLTLCGAVFARKFTRRIYKAMVGVFSRGTGRFSGGEPLSANSGVSLSGIRRHRGLQSERVLQPQYSGAVVTPR